MTQMTTNSQGGHEKAETNIRRYDTAAGGCIRPGPGCCRNYAVVLYEMGISGEAIQKTEELFAEVLQLREVFINPVIREEEKFNVIDQVFPEEVRNFLKVVCRHHRMDLMDDIFMAYYEYCDEQNRVLHAVLRCTEPPDEVQLEKMKAFLCKKYKAEMADIEIRQDEALTGGFILQAGCDEYDWSLQGRMQRLEQKLTRR